MVGRRGFCASVTLRNVFCLQIFQFDLFQHNAGIILHVFPIRLTILIYRQHNILALHSFCTELIPITVFCFLLKQNSFKEQERIWIIRMMFQMESLYIIRENTFIWMVKTNDHTITIVVDAKNILVQRIIDI